MVFYSPVWTFKLFKNLSTVPLRLKMTKPQKLCAYWIAPFASIATAFAFNLVDTCKERLDLLIPIVTADHIYVESRKFELG